MGRAQQLLEQMLGSDASFRDEDQLRAVLALVDRRSKLLVVEKTGWGKSLVYLMATRMLRDQGSGPTLLISPLIALMRNQVEMADKLGIRAYSMTSANPDQWPEVEAALRADSCDLLLVAPERLANEDFLRRTLPLIGKGIGLFVVDEAHCISDWGHDFRPDYRRIVNIVRGLPPAVSLLATTATANLRVIHDIETQLGPDLEVIRGSLTRDSLRLQNIRLEDQAERLAWLAQHVPELPGTGIIYCLTVADTRRVAEWLRQNGIDAAAYYGDLPTDERIELEQRLLRNELKALVATVALGMGFDKPDLGFVVHFQRPGSAVAYYQQIGRAGRALTESFIVLLSGREDDEIQDFFIKSAFPSDEEMATVVQAVEQSAGTTKTGLMEQLNVTEGQIERCLKLLEVDGVIAKQGGKLIRTANPWTPDRTRAEQVGQIRRDELRRMQDYVQTEDCLMKFIANELDDDTAVPCGRCANDSGEIVSRLTDPETVRRAVTFLRRDAQPIPPRARWIGNAVPGHKGLIPMELRTDEGRALCIWGDAGWGEAVRAGKYMVNRFSDDLVQASSELIRERWSPDPFPEWVTAVPSLRNLTIVADFAGRLAATLGLPFRNALVKVRQTAPQKLMENSIQQSSNIAGAFQAVGNEVLPGPVLLVDDVVNSRWTLTICGALLREAASGPVYPYVLATTQGTRRDW